jgi:pimeloyl-ACP methyl ester carboxylesterase
VQLPAPLEGDNFSLDDPRAGKVRVYVAGPPGAARPPLLLIHSVNAAASAFEVRPLFEHYRSYRMTYALDLPGFGLSDRAPRLYDPRLMTDAVEAVVREIRRLHGPRPIDALALSLSSEFLARATTEAPAEFRSLAFVSPTGFNGKQLRKGPPGSTRAVPGLHAVLNVPLWRDGLYRLLTQPSVVRYFLERTWGSREIDEAMWVYDVLTARQPGAMNAPLYFLAGYLFSDDVGRLYEELRVPIWMCHGVRGDFVDYRGAEAMRERPNWRFTVFETGALPHFEEPEAFLRAYDSFLDAVRDTSI